MNVKANHSPQSDNYELIHNEITEEITCIRSFPTPGCLISWDFIIISLNYSKMFKNISS